MEIFLLYYIACKNTLYCAFLATRNLDTSFILLSTISFTTTINIASNIILHSYIHSYLSIYILYRFVWNLNNTRDIFSYSFKSIFNKVCNIKSPVFSSKNWCDDQTKQSGIQSSKCVVIYVCMCLKNKEVCKTNDPKIC